MNIQQAYNSWAEQYDTNKNRTRDLEALSLKETLANRKFNSCLEIGCGTGKNTKWLVEQVENLTAVDFSEGMLAKAKKNVSSHKVNFIQADITENWHFSGSHYNLITFSLVLEHIQNLHPIFEKAVQCCKKGGLIYISELHPFKQYSGSKARFETENGQQVVTCFTHHISDFTEAAKASGLSLVQLNEYFDDEERTSFPRLITFLFMKD